MKNLIRHAKSNRMIKSPVIRVRSGIATAMTTTVPLTANPSQTLACPLGGQNCSINVYQKISGLYLDLYVDGALIIGGVLCENANRIVRDAYLGFVGDLAFFDTQGSDNPVFTGLGARWQLVYLSEAELMTYGLAA